MLTISLFLAMPIIGLITHNFKVGNMIKLSKKLALQSLVICNLFIVTESYSSDNNQEDYFKSEHIQLFRKLEEKHPTLMKGFSKEDTDFEMLNKATSQITDGKAAYQPSLVPLAEKLLNRIEKFKTQDPQQEYIFDYLNLKLKHKKLTLTDLNFLFFSHIGLLTKSRSNGLEFKEMSVKYDVLPGKNLFKELDKEDGFQSFESTYCAYSKDFSVSKEINFAVRQAKKELKDKFTSKDALHPVFNAHALGTFYLAYMYIMEIYPCSYPETVGEHKLHNLEMCELAELIHDAVHANIVRNGSENFEDYTTRIVKANTNFGYSENSNSGNKNLSPEKEISENNVNEKFTFAKPFIERKTIQDLLMYAYEKQNIIRNIKINLMYLAAKMYNEEIISLSELQTFSTGIFMQTHENPVFRFLSAETTDEILKKLFNIKDEKSENKEEENKPSSDSIKENDDELNVENLLRTSVLTGETLMTDEEIFMHAIKNKKNSFKYEDESRFLFHGLLNEKEIVSYKVDRNPYRIKLIVTDQKSEHYQQVFNTLKFIWKIDGEHDTHLANEGSSALKNVKLLEIPNLENVNDELNANEIAITHLKEVEKRFKEINEAAYEIAIKVLTKASLIEGYDKELLNIDSKIWSLFPENTASFIKKEMQKEK